MKRSRKRQRSAKSTRAATTSSTTGRKRPPIDWRPWAIIAGVALAAIIAYWPTTGFEFLNWDDQEYVTGNPHIRDGLTGESISWSLTHFHAGNWHPLSWLSHALDIETFGLNRTDPGPLQLTSGGWHHMTNVLLHAANSVLVFLVLIRLTGRRWPSAVVAAIFAVHPIHVEAVAWVSQRKELLCALFTLLTIRVYIEHAAKPSGRRYAAVVLLFAAALMSKPMAVSLPVVLLVLDYWPLGRLSWRVVREKIPLAAMAAWACVMTVLAQQGGQAVRTVAEVGPLERGVFVIYAYGVSLVKAIVPVAQWYEPMVPRPGRGGAMPEWWLVALLTALLVAVTVVAVRWRRSRPHVLAGWLLFLVMLLPTVGIVTVGDHLVADRYMYVPLVGVMIPVVWLMAERLGRRKVRSDHIGAGVLTALVLFFATTSMVLPLWADSETLWRHVARRWPDYSFAHNNLGEALLRKGDAEGAIASFKRGAEADPDDPMMPSNLGLVLLRQKKFDEAEMWFRKALALGDGDVVVLNGLGQTLLSTGRSAEALTYLRRGLEIDSRYLPLHDNLVRALAVNGQLAEAEVAARRYVELWPDSQPAQRLLELVLAQRKKAGTTE